MNTKAQILEIFPGPLENLRETPGNMAKSESRSSSSTGSTLQMLGRPSQVTSRYLRALMPWPSKQTCEKVHLSALRCFNLKMHDVHISLYTSSTAQGGGRSFKNRKPIGEIGCCESGMAERIHWYGPKGAWGLLSFSLFLWLSTHLPTYLLCIYLSIYLSI